MEKYAVETAVDKTASEMTHCPKCGRVAESHGWVHKCASHGTEAFEIEVPRTGDSPGKLDVGGEPSEG